MNSCGIILQRKETIGDMRRKDREITDRNRILDIMERCEVCRLAFHNEGYPYILPLNFGMKADADKIVLYFHSAPEGTKMELMAKDNRVGFEMDCTYGLELDEEKGNCSINYESVVGRGRIEMVPEEEKPEALNLLMKHYHREDFDFNRAMIPRTAVYRLVVEQLTGKCRPSSSLNKDNYMISEYMCNGG